MIYKFRSAATGDLIMLAAHGDRLLRLLGREPAAQGIFEVADMPAMLVALQAAMAEAEQEPAAGDEDETRPVALRQRLWPMIDMLRRAQQAGEPVVWGV